MRVTLKKDCSDHLAEIRLCGGRGKSGRREMSSGTLVVVEEGEEQLHQEVNRRQMDLPSRQQRRGARMSPKLLTKQPGRRWLKQGRWRGSARG